MDPFLDALIADWQSVVTENWRFTFAIVFGLIMTVLMPIAGLIWYDTFYTFFENSIQFFQSSPTQHTIKIF